MTGRCAVLLAVAILGATQPAGSAADSVRVTVPAGVSFAVTNVGVPTMGAPTATPVSFDTLRVFGPEVLRISLKADSDFTPPGGSPIPASRVSWTTSSASNGTGSAGSLSRLAYAQVFQSDRGKKSGGVSLTWTLAAPGIPVRAGTHSLLVRWKLEAVNP